MKWNEIDRNRKKWIRYFHLFKPLVEGRFLYEFLVPKDILDLVKKIELEKVSDEKVFRFIIGCSFFNAVLIGLPGSIGYGVYISMAFEALIAFQLARMSGLLDVKDSISKLFKLIKATGIAGLTVLYGFKAALNFIFGIISLIPLGGSASFLATFFTTLFYSIFLYLSFTEIKLGDGLTKSMPKRILKKTYQFSTGIFKSFWKLFEEDLPKLLRETKDSIFDACRGIIHIKPKIKGEMFLAGSYAYLLSGNYDGLKGPFAQLWLEAWRESHPTQLKNATVEEIKELADSYDAESFPRLVQNVNSKFYEKLETTHENADGDEWSAELIVDQNHPASDAVFYNQETGQYIEINYKFTLNENYIESHIQRYPDVPVVAPPEVAEKINSPLVMSGHYEHGVVLEISEANFDDLLNKSHSLYLEAATIASGGASLLMHIFPFLMAYYKGTIGKELLFKALKTFYPKIAGRTLNRIGMLTLLGPVYGMFLIASFVFKSSLYGYEDIDKDKSKNNDEASKIVEEVTEKEEKPQPKTFSRRGLITLSFLKDV
ncbi:hypothetical protein OAD33_03080 [Alphaproteobacteria bacterium]|nr:hypothetical protein [Alphaproteobacteria bacterium]